MPPHGRTVGPVTSEHDVWAVGDAYEAYIGRWSRPVAHEFVRWLAGPAGGRWVDVGCGTGALTATVLAATDPAHVLGVDPSSGFLAGARARVTDPRASFQVGDAQSLPLPDRSVDAVVSGLALNFVPNPQLAATEIARILVPGGVTGAYVWDYADGMGMLRTSGTPRRSSIPLRSSWTRASAFRCAATTPWPGCGRTPVSATCGFGPSKCPLSSPTSTTTGGRSSAVRARLPGT